MVTETLSSKGTEIDLDVSSGDFDIPSPSNSAIDYAFGESSSPEWDKVITHHPDIAAIPRQSYGIPGDQTEHINFFIANGDVSPTPSTIVPSAPPTTPATPKREIKLVTAGSSAADWFTHGFVGVASEALKPTIKETSLVNVEHSPPESKIDIQQNPVDLVDYSPKVDQVDSAVVGSNTSMTGFEYFITADFE